MKRYEPKPKNVEKLKTFLSKKENEKETTNILRGAKR